MALAGIVALGAALRFATLDLQSYRYDEAVTVVRILHPSLFDTLSTVPGSESTPPLYYLVAWLWSRPFGTGEVGLRSLSALAGTASIAVVYLGAVALSLPRRAGLIAAAMVAVSPVLIWFSQDARAYALVFLLTALSFLYFARALRAPHRRRADFPPNRRIFGPSAPGAAGAEEEEEGCGAQEDQQRVGSGVLGVPDQHRADGDDRRDRDAGAAAGQLPPDHVGDGDRGGAEQRRERAQAHLMHAERLRPQPRHQVVERRGRLPGPHLVHRLRQAGAENPARSDRLVVAVALQAQAGESDRRPQRGEPEDCPQEPSGS